MSSVNTLPRLAQWSAGVGLMAVALTAGGLSFAVNVTAGLGIGLGVAVAYGLADCGKLLLPIVCRGIGWSIHTRTAYIVVSLVSVLCACLYLADANGGDLLNREHAATVQTDNAKRIAELEQDVARTRDLAAQEAARGGCGPQCKALQDRADSAALKLSDARRQRAAAPAGALPGSAVLAATLLGASETGTARNIAIAKSIAALAVMELLAHLAGAAAALIGLAMRSRKPVANIAEPVAKLPENIAKLVANVETPVASEPASPPAKLPAVGTRAYYFARLEREFPDLASQVRNGNLSTFRASIAAGLRKEPKARKWDANEYA